MVNFSPTKALSTLVNPDKILPVAIIEVATTGGRVYQGFKRGGETEGKERLREETSTAIFWLGGVKLLNKFGDFIGNKLGVKHLDVDLGRDELRAPYLNIPQADRLKTCAFKFSKVIASAAIATALTGFILPKINHKITNYQRKKRGLEPIPDKQAQSKQNKAGAPSQNSSSQNSSLQSAPNALLSMDNFVQQSKQNAKELTFKGAAYDIMATLAHNIENKTAWRLMSTDAGMIAGRVANSRNKAEGLEFLFRDTASIYFYLFAAPNVAALLSKISDNPYVQPDSAQVIKNHLVNSLGDNKLAPDEFKNAAKNVPDGTETFLNCLPFNKDGIITLEDFNTVTDSVYADKAEIMSQMQPKRGGVSLLSRQQVENILSDGWCSEPEFLKQTVNAGTYGNALNPKKYVPRRTVESIVSSVDRFTDKLVRYAKSKGVNEIDADFIKKFTSRITKTNLAFRVAGMCFAGFGLAYLVPKLQYKISEITTGSKDFPVTAGYDDVSDNKN